MANTPCPECGSCTHEPFFFSKHLILSGFFAPMLFSLRRCSGCGTDYSTRSGRRASAYVWPICGILATAGAFSLGAILFVAFTVSELKAESDFQEQRRGILDADIYTVPDDGR